MNHKRTRRAVVSSPAYAEQANLKEARELSIQRCIQSLVHACKCSGANCRLPSCQKMKRVVQHTKICKRKTDGGCPICKQLITLCCYHANHCQETNKCPAPFCPTIKQKLKDKLMQQRMATQNSGGAMPVTPTRATPATMGIAHPGPGGTPQAAMMGLQSPHHGMEPGAQPPPPSILVNEE